jgi:hypothetical protein
MTSLSCCIDFHDDLMYGLGFLDCVELFGVEKSQFKKANGAEVRKNKIHMKEWMTKYEEVIGNWRYGLRKIRSRILGNSRGLVFWFDGWMKT